MEEALHNLILERLVADDEIDTVAANLVEAACQGPETLATVVGSGSALLLVKPQPPVHMPASSTVGAYLTKLKVAGFRGIGSTATLDVSPGPGLTLIVGRNGSGKSSFAEAFEVLVTGKCARWRGRPVWEDGWRNLHHSSGQTRIEATFVTEGALPMTVARSWKAGGSLADVEVTARGSERPTADFDALPWQEASAAFRPFLSHSELSSLLDEPSRLYDQLKSILGLEALTAAVRNLSEQKKQLRDHKKEVAEELAALKQTLQTCADPRAATCLGALAGKKWKLDAIEQIVLGAAATDETQLAVLRAVAQLAVPDMEEVVRVADRLRVAVQEERQLSATAASRNNALVALLEQALQYQVSHGGDCPVCEAPLASSWADNGDDHAMALDLDRAVRDR
jgi:DNA repair exonuclease SbcCD ATPase subunit